MQFLLNGEVQTVEQSTHLHQSSADYIRNVACCKSVKLGCGEGGCGACAVELVTTDPATGEQSVVAVNSCLTPLAALAGCHVITSEGLGSSRRDSYHEVHRRLAGFHATQCGFCTPGMAISCHAALMAAAQRQQAAAAAASANAAGGSNAGKCKQHLACNGGSSSSSSCKRNGGGGCSNGTSSSGCSDSGVAGPAAAELLAALDGNLCRCTGWRPIADAVKSFACDVDMEDLGLHALRPEQLGPITCPAASEPGGSSSSSNRLLPAALKQQPQQQLLLAGHQQDDRAFAAALQQLSAGCVLRPASLQQLLAAASAAKAAGVRLHLLAGNTGAGIYKDQWQRAAAGACVLVKHVTELQQLQVSVDGQATLLTAGAGVTISRLLQALQDRAAAEALAGRRRASSNLGHWVRHISRIAGTLVRNAATLGGHLWLAGFRGLESDLATIFVAAGAEVELTDLQGNPSWLLVENFLPAAAAAAAGTEAGTEAGAGGSANDSNGAPPAGAAAAALLQQLHAGAAVITAVRLPLPLDPDDGSSSSRSSTAVWSHKLTIHRRSNEHAAINICCWLAAAGTDDGLLADANSSNSSSSSYQLRVAVGTYQSVSSSSNDGATTSGAAVAWRCKRARVVEAALLAALQQQQAGKSSGSSSLDVVLRRLPELLLQDIQPAGSRAEYARSVAPGLLMKGLAVVLPEAALPQQQPAPAAGPGTTHSPAALLLALRAGEVTAVEQGGVVPRGRQELPVDLSAAPPLYWPISKDSSLLQASGEAAYTDDCPATSNALFAAFVTSGRALAAIQAVDWSPAMEVAGVVGFVGPDDIPAGRDTPVDNSPMDRGEPLFAWDKVEYFGQPLGLVVATSPAAARAGAARVAVTYAPVPAAAASATDGSDGGSTAAAAAITTLEAAVAADSWHNLKGAPFGATEAARGRPIAEALSAAPRLLSGRLQLGSQRHAYMEPQTAVASPAEAGRMSLVSSCQGVDQVMWSVARLLQLQHNQVAVTSSRVGGSFGGKADRAVFTAAAAAVAAHKLRRQVRLVVDPAADGLMNGGRCPLVADWTAGIDGSGGLQALKLDITCLGGAFVGGSTIEVVSIALATDSVYDIPNLAVNVRLARANLPPRTTVRGPGKVSGIIIIEAVLQQLAAALGRDPTAFRESLMLALPPDTLAAAAAAAAADAGSSQAAAGPIPHPRYLPSSSSSSDASLGDAGAGDAPQQQQLLQTAFGKPIELRQFTLPFMWQQLQHLAAWQQRVAAAADFNRCHPLQKRGLALVPIRYQLVHRSALARVSIFADGSLLLSHPGTEMGQGISTKVKQAAAHALSSLLLPQQQQQHEGDSRAAAESLLPLMRVDTGSTELLPHAGLAAASTTSEAATAAVAAACLQLVERLQPTADRLAAEESQAAAAGEAAGGGGDGGGSSAAAAAAAAARWQELIQAVTCFGPVVPSQVVLCAVGRSSMSDAPFFAPGGIYHSFGVAAAEVLVDVVTGERVLLRADLLFDAGRSISPAVDLGQVEGAFMQGVGHVMTEEVVEDEQTGAHTTNTTWTYKPPGMAELPQELNVHMLADSPLHISKHQQLSAKATGEPPFMLAAAVACALQDAVAAAWDDQPHGQQQQQRPALQLPATTANIRAALPPVLFA